MRGSGSHGVEVRTGRRRGAAERGGAASRGVAMAMVSALLAGLLVGLPGRPSAAAATVPAGFTDTPVFTGFDLPTTMAFSPDGKVYVAEKSGVITVFPSTALDQGVVFKDLSERVFDYWDRGLLGLTVDPRLGDGSGHDFVYALYAKDAPPGQTPPVWDDYCPNPPGGETDGCVVSGTLSRIPVNEDGTAGTEQILIDDEWCQQFTSHSVGDLTFGDDGYLYVSGGEGANWSNADWGQFGGTLPDTPTVVNPCGDPPGGEGVKNTKPTGRGGAMRSQSPRRPAGEPRVLNGSVLRIDPDTGEGAPGNPLAGSSDENASRILAYGMRNPFRFTMRPGTDQVWVGDVGQSTYEEIDVIPSRTPTVAPNFGWPCYEGDIERGGYSELDMCGELYEDTVDPQTDAFFRYDHLEMLGDDDTCAKFQTGSSISGLAFYTGSSYPAQYSDALFVADNSRNCIWVMSADEHGVPDPSTARTFVDDADNPFPVDLEIDPVSGDLFYVNIALGTVNRISYDSTNRAPVAVASATPRSGTAPLEVRFDGSGSTDPDGDPLTYSWDIDGDGTYGDATGASPTVTYDAGGTYRARLMVTDPGGLHSTSSAVTITVDNPTGPRNDQLPTISGEPEVGGTLTTTEGVWSGAGPITRTTQWQRCRTVTGTPYSEAVLDDSPLVHWRLGESAGTTAVDASGNGQNGTYVGGVGLSRPGALTGDGDTAASFDGADDVVERAAIAGMPATELSVDLWLKTTDTTKEGGIVSYASAESSADEFQLRDPRSLAVYVIGTRVDTNVALNDGQWHHLAVTWASAGGEVRVYKDGALAHSSSGVRAGYSLAGGGTLVLGQEQDSPGGGYDPSQAYLGDLDEVALYPSVLSAAQVEAHHDAAPATGDGSTCTDISGATGSTYSPQLTDEDLTIRTRVTASNPGGANTVHSAEVGPVTGGSGNTAPVPFIDTPTGGLSWSAGDQITFSGGATDAEDGAVPAERLRWDVVVGHCPSGCHDHFLYSSTGASGTIVAPEHQAPSFLEFTLTATDAAGATATTVRRIDPVEVELTFRTSPAGLQLAVGDAEPKVGPFTQKWVANSQVQMGAPLHQTLAGTTYEFTGWSDGGDATHIVNAPAQDATYTATYSPIDVPDVGGGALVGISPNRVLDTRIDAQGPCVAGVRQVAVAPSTGVPADAAAVALSVTVVEPSAQGYVTVYPAGETRPKASNLNYVAGQVVPNLVTTKVGAGGRVNVYASGGCPDVLVDVTGYYTGGDTSPGGFVGISPTRALDTRTAAQGPCVSGPGGRQLVVAPHAAAQVPAGAGAVALNVTVVEPTSQGYLTVYPAGQARPTASNLNYVADQVVPNHVTTKVGTGGRITVFASGGCPDVIVDIVGYYAGGEPSPGGFAGVSPNRVFDSRNRADRPCVAGTREVTVAPSAGVPADAEAVVLNVTAVKPRSPGYLSVYPGDAPRPTASNLNYRAGQVVPNAVITGVDDGTINLYSSGGCPDVIVDVVGYHVGGTGT